MKSGFIAASALFLGALNVLTYTITFVEYNNDISNSPIYNDKNNLLIDLPIPPSNASSSSSHLHIWIARTLSSKDIETTILDIEALTDKKKNMKIEWKLFCYTKQAHELLLLQRNLPKDIEIFYEQGVNKMFFWERYLHPDRIPKHVDYVWPIDGDISLSGMSWKCFWDTVLKYKPAISQPAIMNPSEFVYKSWAGVVLPHKCQEDCMTSRPRTNLHQLEVMETGIVEMQVSLLTRKAWTVIHSVVSKKIPDWGQHQTCAGLDMIWCSLIDQELYGVSPKKRVAFQQETKINWVRKTEVCAVGRSFEKYENSSLPVACMVIQSTPVQHHDTRTLKIRSKEFKSEEYTSANLYRKQELRDEVSSFFFQCVPRCFNHQP